MPMLSSTVRRLVAALALAVLPSLFASVPAAHAYGPAASSGAPNRLDVFVRGTDMAVWHRWFDGSSWQWESLGGVATSDIASVSSGSGRIDLFMRGFGGSLWHKSFAGSWSPWEVLGGQLDAEPAAISLAAGTLDVLVEGTDQGLWRASYDSSGWHWALLGGRLAAAPSVASSAPGRLDVLVEGTDHQLWLRTLTAGGGTWEAHGASMGSGPSAVSTAAGGFDIFMRGSDGALWHEAMVQGNWSLAPLGGRLSDRPTAAWAGTGTAQAFVVGLDNAVWHWANGAWEPLYGQVQGRLATLSASPGTLDLFAQGTSAALLHRAWTSNAWQAWESFGGILIGPNDPVTLPVPLYGQHMALDCETAALEMALASLGSYYTQSDLFALENPDTRPPVLDSSGHILRWGDPYTNFVGNVNGSENPPTGYGIYYPVILAIGNSHGAPFASGADGVAPTTVYEAIAAGHPVQVWVETNWARAYVGYWTAWDGRRVRYSSAEHSVTVLGVRPDAILVNDPWRNAQYWVSKATFETSFADFNDMAIIY